MKDLAEVSVNGKALGTLWKPPYQVDVTGVLKPGANQLEIKVTNQWTNRQIGDRSLPAGEAGACRRRRHDGQSRDAGARLLPESGLIGPVTLISEAIVEAAADGSREI